MTGSDYGAREAYREQAAFATLLLRERRRREEMLGRKLFADPAWDMMLDLFIAAVEGRAVAMSSVVQAAAVPQSTALRWMAQLAEAGILKRWRDMADGRRSFIGLTEPTFAAMAALLTAWMVDTRALFET